jgi:ribosomal-protein-alanine N-acetyltransferase
MMLDGVSVRLAVEQDIPEIVEIERVSFADPWSADSFVGSLDHFRMCFLVAEADMNGGPALLGYVITLLLSEEAEVANLAVAPAGRRRGVGGLLLDRAVAESAGKGVNTVYLEVRESNVAARALYDSRSFQQVGRRKGYYRHPVEDALLLRRDLGSS